MSMTTGPLTVEPSVITRDGDWSVYDSSDNWVASFKSEADARAFVALPALEAKLKQLISDWRARAENGPIDLARGLEDAAYDVEAALAQADGPKEQP